MSNLKEFILYIIAELSSNHQEAVLTVKDQKTTIIETDAYKITFQKKL